MTISQEQYVKSILTSFNLLDCKPNQVPLSPSTLRTVDTSLSTSTHTTATQTEQKQYPTRQAIGALLYLSTCTRPDISFAVNRLSSYTSYTTSSPLWTAIKSIIRYLRGTASYCLTYTYISSPTYTLTGYTDASWGDTPSRKSTSGYSVFMNHSLVSWQSKRQPIIALSTTEAELVALCTVITEAIWLQKLISSCTSIHSSAIPIFLSCDNQPTIHTVQNSSQHGRTKHIDIKLKYIRDMCSSRRFDLSYIPTEENPSDIFTKPLDTQKHSFHTFFLFNKID